jgi:D-xylulose reductase
MGHEASGVIHSVGNSVDNVKVGTKVAIEPGFPCRRCRPCKAGRYNFCKDMTFAASPPTSNSKPGKGNSHGTLTKYFKIPADFCYPLPDGIGLDEGVLLEPLSVAVHVARLAKVKVGMNVVVFGAGTIGLLCAAVAKAFGANKTISVDINAERLEFAKNFASTDTYLPDSSLSAQQNAEKMISDFGLDEGADVVLEASGAEPSIETGIHVLCPGGTFIQAGLGKTKIQFPIVAMSEKELTVRGSFRYSAGDYETAMHLLVSGKVSVKSLITGVEPFERATEAWERTKRSDGIKNLIRGPQD